ncbi:MAG: TOBE domain-containing protein [Lentisphaerae bacterium]|nr:MAG: TOBE domain-containing protein [Lentisphaerota bacterium]
MTESAGVHPGSQVKIVLRPENLQICDTESTPAEDLNMLRGRLVDEEYGGAFTTRIVELEDGVQMSVRAISGETVEVNAEVGLRFRVKDTLVLAE